jgi:hypothetical protein
MGGWDEELGRERRRSRGSGTLQRETTATERRGYNGNTATRQRSFDKFRMTACAPPRLALTWERGWCTKEGVGKVGWF